MDILKQYFPHAFKSTETNNFIINLIIYIVIDVICGLVGWIIGGLGIAILGWLIGIIGVVVGLYALIGIILSILVFAKVIQ